MSKLCVILLNFGGPSSLDDVRPFLFNLFSDPHIIRLPALFRFALAFLISRLRSSKAKNIYQAIGGKSPILKETKKQAQALLASLYLDPNMRSRFSEMHVLVGMRSSYPFIKETLFEAMSLAPDYVVLLPLYPQFSTTTTLSSFDEWDDQIKRLKKPELKGFNEQCHRIHHYCEHPLFIDAHVDLIECAYKEAFYYGNPRILFSAHSLPLSIVAKGDPYPDQIQKTVNACVLRLLKKGFGCDNEEAKKVIDFVLCYQSKVGRAKWLEPSLLSELKRAAKDSVPVVVVPISFVGEHSETLYELDIEYKEEAQKLSVPFYKRVPTLSVHPLFIEALTDLVKSAVSTSCVVVEKN